MGVYTWIGNFDVESVTNEDISCGEVAMNEPMLCQKILCIKATSKIKDDYNLSITDTFGMVKNVSLFQICVAI